jgi:hypothetical protein
MVGKAQKSHGASSGLYGGCSNGVLQIHFFQAEHRIHSRNAADAPLRKYLVAPASKKRSFKTTLSETVTAIRGMKITLQLRYPHH